MNNQSEFYVGYLPPGPRLRKAIRTIAVALPALAAAVGVVLAGGQQPFAESAFEFQQYREFRGTLLAEPYPALLIPGGGRPWLLVGPGKHGVAGLASFDGAQVRVTGERISRGEDHMIELRP